MRILQIIDSLEIGGAERMAVNYANALATKIEFSGIIVTRKEGLLKNKINKNVAYFFLERTTKIDFKAVFKLKKICLDNNVTHVQAHSSSFFISFLTKLVCPRIKIIWHDHNGLSEFISSQKSYLLKFASYFFSGIVAVNDKLKKWAESELNCKHVIYLQNFTSIENDTLVSTVLKGNDNKRILCLANLRFQKNHFFLLEVAKIVKQTHPDWSFHLIGKDFEDDYSTKIKDEIKNNSLENLVFIYGSKSDVQNILNQTDIAILTSQSEGLPVAVLEFGLNKKPLVTTNVGEIPNIIIDSVNGFITDKKDFHIFASKINKLIEDENLRNKIGYKLFETISTKFSEDVIIDFYIKWLNKLNNV